MTENVNTDAFEVPMGNQLVIETWEFHPGWRTPKQFNAVRQIMNSPNFDFSCSGRLFDYDIGDKPYTGPFVFMWYNKPADGESRQGSCKLHYARIGAHGNILQSDVLPLGNLKPI